MHIQREIDNLKKRILALSAEVEHDLLAAVRAVEERNPALAHDVISGEIRTNAMEVDVEEECLKILALHQPVAADLRYIVAVLKINQDLERIGDLAVHIAERSLELCKNAFSTSAFPLGRMADLTRLQLKKVLDAFVNLRADQAREVCLADRALDALNSGIYEQIQKGVMETPADFAMLLNVMSISRHLERIGDHTTNIAEDLIYLIEGRIVRHTELG
ncbi:MAG: phosphate signaling complex protein PhoU [Kiritimatiellia bacterium]